MVFKATFNNISVILVIGGMESAELLQASITWNLMEKGIKIFSECTNLQLNFRGRDPMIVGFATVVNVVY
jgi:hypothetical protein